MSKYLVKVTVDGGKRWKAIKSGSEAFCEGYKQALEELRPRVVEGAVKYEVVEWAEGLKELEEEKAFLDMMYNVTKSFVSKKGE